MEAMQIGPSQRRKGPPKGFWRADAPAALHERLAQQRSLDTRLLRGGGLALAASLTAWVVGAPLLPHLLATALGFALGLLWRPRQTGARARAWALEWIEAQIGLSYRTALELPAADTTPDTPGAQHPDPYGLGAAVRRRAEASTKRLVPPPSQPWWLPLAVLALLFALLPALNLPGFRAPFGTPFGALPPGAAAPPPLADPGDDPTAQAPPPPPEGDTTETEAPVEGSPEAAASPPERAASEEADDTTASPGNPADAGTGDGSGDGSPPPPQEEGEAGALERYLSSLGEVEEPEETPDDLRTSPDGGLGLPPDALSPDTRFGNAESPDGRPGSTAETAPPSDSSPPDDAPSSPAREDAGDEPPTDAPPTDDAGDQANGSDPEADEGTSGAEGSEGAQEAPQDEGTPAGSQAGQQDEDAPSPEEVRTEGDATAPGEGDAFAEGGETGEGSASASDQDEGAEPGGANGVTEEAAGAAESADAQGAAQAGTRGDGLTEGAGERLGEGLDGALQRLPGARDEAGPTQSGEVLQPGSDDVTLPSPQEGTDFARAAEEAVREGRLPLEYQDIVREYFR